MNRRAVLAAIENALKPEEGKHTVMGKRGVIRLASPSQRIITPRVSAEAIFNALAAAGVLELEDVD